MSAVADFRALARSAPWLWSRLTFTCEWTGYLARFNSAVSADLDDSGRLRVCSLATGKVLLDLSGQDVRGSAHRDSPAGSFQAVASFVGDHPDELAMTVAAQLAAEQAVVRRRDDGLVAVRPVGLGASADPPIWDNYRWVAMLDPVELADGRNDCNEVVSAVEICELAPISYQGRDSLQAILRPTGAYSPRCSCCPLLDCAVADEMLGWPDRGPGRSYAECYEVVLDIATGVCVRTRDIGGDRDGQGHDLQLTGS